MNLASMVAERTEVPKKTVAQVYDGLLEVIKEQLKEERKIRLNGFATITLRYLPARKAGKKPSPFKKGEMMVIKAREATNKLRLAPAKDMKEFAKGLKVVKPKK